MNFMSQFGDGHHGYTPPVNFHLRPDHFHSDKDKGHGHHKGHRRTGSNVSGRDHTPPSLKHTLLGDSDSKGRSTNHHHYLIIFNIIAIIFIIITILWTIIRCFLFQIYLQYFKYIHKISNIKSLLMLWWPSWILLNIASCDAVH